MLDFGGQLFNMANIFHIERTANRITLGTTGTSVYLKSLTATSVPFIDTAGLIAEDSLFTWNKTTNYLDIGYLRLGGERRILANGPGADNGLTLNAEGTGGIYFNYVDGGSGGVHFYDGASNQLIRFMGDLGYGSIRLYDQDDAEYLDIKCCTQAGFIDTKGVAPGILYLQNDAQNHIYMFQGSTSGETKSLKVYGYKSGDSKRALSIVTGGSAADTVDFTGLSNYKFGGIIQASDLVLTDWQTGTPTYNSVHDWMNTTQSPGLLSIEGSGITVNEGDNTKIDVAAGTGFVKKATSDLGATVFVNWDAASAITLTDNQVNKIYVNYNTGTGAVTVAATTGVLNYQTQFSIGKVYSDNGTLHIVNGGTQVYNLARRVHKRAREL